MLTIPSSQSNETIMAASYIGKGGEDYQPNQSHRIARRHSCVGPIEHAPSQPPPSFKAKKLAPPASDSIPRRPRRTMSPVRSETTCTTAAFELPVLADDTCYGYEDTNSDQRLSECNQPSREILESRRISQRGSALGRLQQLQSMGSDAPTTGGHEDSNEGAQSTSNYMFHANTRRHHSAADDIKWSANYIREAEKASPSPQHNRRRMSVGDFVKKQLQSMRSDTSTTGGQDDSNERAQSTSNYMFPANIRRHQSAAADLKWSASTIRETEQASPSPQNNSRRMSVGDFVKNWRTNLDISGLSGHSNPDANGEKRSSNKHIRGSKSSTDPSTWSSRSNPDASVRSNPRSMDSNAQRSRSNPDIPARDSHRRSAERKRIDHLGSAALGQRQDGWNGQAPNQAPDTVTLDRLQGLAKMKLARDQSIMSLMSKESGISKESTISKDSQANRDYGIPWWK